MTRSIRNPAVLLAPLLVFGAVWAMLTLVNRSADAPPAPRRAAPSLGSVSSRTPGDRMRALQRAIAAEPANAAAYAALGDLYLQRARSTGDPSWYTRAGRAFDAALRRDPGDAGALIGAGTLANQRHDFRAGLRLGRAARRAQPALVAPYVVLADAQLELGRYAAAAHAIQRLVDRKPGVPAYARASYFRELSGDRAGAVAAMRLAVSAAGTPADAASVDALLGDLELAGGQVDAARHAYHAALAAVPGHPDALAGLARVAAARGDLPTATRLLRRSTDRLPVTTHLTLLAEVELAAGRRAAAARALDAVRAQARRERAAGVRLDAERVLFAADHGAPGRAVALGRRVWREAPSVRSADALGWALTRAGRPRAGLAWARRALRLGSRDPLWRLHAGLAAQAAGRPDLAARDLRIAAAGRPALSPLAARRLEAARR